MRSCVPRLLPAALLAGLCAVAASTANAATLTLQALGTDGRPLPETVVFLESREARAAARPLGPVEVAQSERRFVPRVSVVTPGTAVRFPNRDTVRHHVYSFSPAKTFELKLYTGTPAKPVLFDKPGIAVLGCNIHDSMVAWVLVVETPHHAVADAQGVLRLEAVPPGSYRLRSWHPALPPGTPPGDEALLVPAAGASLSVRLPLTAGSL
jgi:plastocyanin